MKTKLEGGEMPKQARGNAGDQVGRIFRDASGRSWTAVFSIADGAGALEFTCMGDPREPQRVMAVSAGFSFLGITDESLRGWLAAAPRLGRLTE